MQQSFTKVVYEISCRLYITYQFLLDRNLENLIFSRHVYIYTASICKIKHTLYKYCEDLNVGTPSKIKNSGIEI